MGSSAKNAPIILSDDAARAIALGALDRSLLVEAGAGSGKTAVMAGRIAMMLVQGIAPAAIAAVTFTELAASELLFRVRGFVTALRDGRVPTEMRNALPTRLSHRQAEHLAIAAANIDDITCSTIHGFCQRLIMPYPIEADIDPGATVMSGGQAELVLENLLQEWLRERLSVDDGGVVVTMAVHNLSGTLELVRQILKHLRQNRHMTAQAPLPLAPLVANFKAASAAFQQYIDTTVAKESETASIAARFCALAASPALRSMEDAPIGYLTLLTLPLHEELCKKDGDFRSYSKKGRWVAAAKAVGLSNAEGGLLSERASVYYAACCSAWGELQQQVASALLALLVNAVRPLMELFQQYKRATALLDFDDLIVSARNLLRDHPAVRAALRSRFAHILVDEFQDTDVMQSEIFWRLCGDARSGSAGDDWTAFRIRPGALFLVGDPKQAIYRFRGADVAAYVQARASFQTQDPDSLLSIMTNFRSRAPILGYVNERFEPLLSAEGQPGFTALEAFHPALDDIACVLALDVAVPTGSGKPSVEQLRDAEADAVADACARMIGNMMLPDHRSGQRRACRPGDIALLAPSGSDLWRYENALERNGIPVATQAGKGFFQRQEIQDLVALTRVLADYSDTLAFGALLRGPLVGMTEEQLLDLVWALPRDEENSSALPRLHVGIAPEHVAHPLARDLLERLQGLRRGVSGTTPHYLLSTAIDVLRVRLIVQRRHSGNAERALANIDLYLGMSQSFDIGGMSAFARAMTTAWKEGVRVGEGRPDAQEEAVSLVTMHAAKGLEWPIVIPINTMTGFVHGDGSVQDRSTGRFYCKVLGVSPAGHRAAMLAEKAELERERIRLWYVAATRARELLVLPRADCETPANTWMGLFAAPLSALPALELLEMATATNANASASVNLQTAAMFAREAADIQRRRVAISWHAPSRVEVGPDGAMAVQENAGVALDAVAVTVPAPAEIQGGRERGLIIHKLLEEVLSGECCDDPVSLVARADELILSFNLTPESSTAHALSPSEMGNCVARTLLLPEIRELRPRLVAEYPVYASSPMDGEEQVHIGVADAVALDEHLGADIVIDWKSDVAATQDTLAHYKAQVQSYLGMTGARLGLVVLVTSGTVLQVVAPGSGLAA